MPTSFNPHPARVGFNIIYAPLYGSSAYRTAGNAGVERTVSSSRIVKAS